MRKCTLSRIEEQIRGLSIDKSKRNCPRSQWDTYPVSKMPQVQEAKMVSFEQPSSFPRAKLVTSPKTAFGTSVLRDGIALQLAFMGR
jgi:hypothetical protein